jgi:hypothetical protein
MDTIFVFRKESQRQSANTCNEHQNNHPRTGSLDILFEKAIVDVENFLEFAHEVSLRVYRLLSFGLAPKHLTFEVKIGQR